MQSTIAAHLPALRTLLTVVDVGSLTGAGRRLGLTPSGVSKQLGRLEEALGARLLERTTRRVRPTLAGLELCQRARPLFEAFDDAARAVRAETETIAGSVRVSAAPAFGRAVLLPVLRELSAAHSALRFEVTLTGRRLDLVEDGIDLAIREGALQDSALVARSLGVARVGLYASPSYLARRGKPRSLRDLARHEVVMIPVVGELGRLARRLALVARFQVDDLFSVAELAEAGAGIAPLPDYVARPRVERGGLAPVLAQRTIARIPIQAVYPSRRHLPRRVTLVIEALLRVR
ncbi:MAG: LysR family transcriptional regulator [Deltaproteobacteria bacterium]|nr:LysR family transcriptional regulator [Deltaproteobacteria bacterium]